MRVGQKIKELREAKKLTQEQLANHIRSTKQTIFKYENDMITNIPMNKLEIIAKVLGCTPAYLMGWSDCKQQSNSKYSNNQVVLIAPGGQRIEYTLDESDAELIEIMLNKLKKDRMKRYEK